MFRKIWLINFVLIIISLTIMLEIYDIWHSNEVIVSRTSDKHASITPYQKSLKSDGLPPESTYNILVEKNLFSPDRKENFPSPKPEPVAKPEPTKNSEPKPEPEPEIKRSFKISDTEILLYGVFISNDTRTALINNPLRSEKSHRYIWVSEGDFIAVDDSESDDVKISSINNYSIMLSDGSDRYEIIIYNKEKAPSVKEKDKSQNPVVVRTLPEKNKRVVPAQKMEENKEDEEDEFLIIKTPMGDVKRRKKK